MIFYLALDENGHRQLRGTQADARAVNKQFEQIDIPTDKAGLMAFVQDLFDQVDTVGAAPREELALEGSSPSPLPPPEPAPGASNTAQILAFEDEWENFPLARKLHFAALATEEARIAIKPRNQDMASIVGEDGET